MKNKSKKNNTRDKSYLKPLLVALPLILAMGLGGYLYINKKNQASKVTITATENNVEKANMKDVLSNNAANTKQVEPVNPRIVIPNKPGNIKEIITILSNKAGFQVDWKLKGYYNLSAEEIPLWNNPINLVLTPLTEYMTFKNKELMIYWSLGNPGEPFPYPVNVMTLLCGKTLMFFELEIPEQINKLLAKEDFKHCTIPNLADSLINNEDMQQFDFSKPPPFLKQYDPAAPQPQATENEKINPVQVDPKFSNQVQPIQAPPWAIPNNMQPVEVPTLEQLRATMIQ